MKYGTIESTIAAGGPSFGRSGFGTGTVMLSPSPSTGTRTTIDGTPDGVDNRVTDGITFLFAAVVITSRTLRRAKPQECALVVESQKHLRNLRGDECGGDECGGWEPAASAGG